MNHHARRSLRAACLIAALGPTAPAQGPEEATLADGRRVFGRVAGDAAGGYRFVPEAGGPALPLERVAEVLADGSPPPADVPPPRWHALLHAGQRVSGRLAGLDPAELRLDDGPGRRAVRVARAGVRALVQRPGEAVVFDEGFEALEPRWQRVGNPELAAEPRAAGKHSLRLPAGGSAATYTLPAPVAAGRFEVSYYDPGTSAEGQRWFVDLTFRGPDDVPAPIRAVPGWDGPTPAVESPEGPALAVQPLTRRAGWHRLVVRFGPGRTALAVDGDELAVGDGPKGPLVQVRLATESLRLAPPPPAGLAAHLDDLRITRLAVPGGRPEVDPSQDEVRDANGDQLFGTISSADPERVQMVVDGTPRALPWVDIAGLYLRAEPRPSAAVEGLWVRLAWRVEGREVDLVEGALAAVDATSLTLETPYAGTLSIPRGRLKRLEVLGRCRRQVIDPTPHHLGNSYVPDLDPPQPGGGVLEVPLRLDEVPPGASTLAVDVVQVVGESGNVDFSDEVRQGFLRTNVLLNGTKIDYLNRHIRDRNDAPTRVRLPIPAGLLRAGANTLRFEQSGMKADAEKLDNLGVLAIAVEQDAPGARP